MHLRGIQRALLSSQKKLTLGSALDPSWTPHYAGIVAYWPFNGTPGPIANADPIPATIGPNMTANTVSTASMQYGAHNCAGGTNALFADGTAEVDLNQDYSSNSFAFSAWIKRSALNADVEALIASSIQGDLSIGINGDDTIYINDTFGNGPTFQYDSTGTISDTNWHHIVVNFQFVGNVEFYIDGILSGSTLNFNSFPLNPGNFNLYYNLTDVSGGLINYFSGAMDEVSIYTGGTLTGSDVAWLYNAGAGRNITSSVPSGVTPAGYFKFETFPSTLVSFFDVVTATVGANGNANAAGPMAYAAGGGVQANGQYAVFDDAGFPSGNAARSVSLWFKVAVHAQSFANPDVIEYGTDNFQSGWIVYMDSGGGIGISQNGNGLSASDYVDNTWHHFAATMSGSSVYNLYIDGVNQGSNTQTTTTTLSGASTLFQNTNISAAPFFGTVKELAYWNVELSAANVLAIYNRQK